MRCSNFFGHPLPRGLSDIFLFVRSEMVNYNYLEAKVPVWVFVLRHMVKSMPSDNGKKKALRVELVNKLFDNTSFGELS